jgi:outer membrane protein OmpA-like peptidoglycan-associated protein
MRYSVWLTVLFFPAFLAGQNLVPNPGFESYRKIPPTYCHSAKEFRDCMEDWTLPNLATSDYFNSKCRANASTNRNNFAGFQKPKEGEAYAGFYLYEDHSANYREYLQVKLLAPLRAGTVYDIRFYISLSESSVYAIDRLGVLFLKKPSKQHNVFIIPKAASVETPEGVYFEDKTRWMEVHLSYTARGNERFLVVGNFRRNEDMHRKEVPVNRKKYFKESGTYYYVDDVCVSEQASAACPCTVSKDSIPVVTAEIPGDTAGPVIPELSKPVVFNSVFFDSDSHELKKESFPALDSLADFLQAFPEYSIEIRGHTDNSGQAEKNLRLSEERARSVGLYLVSRGVAKERVSWKGFGDTVPVADNATAEGRAKNRRVEYMLLKR